MGNVKYSAMVPRNVKEALLFDKADGDNLWKEAIIKGSVCNYGTEDL